MKKQIVVMSLLFCAIFTSVVIAVNASERIAVKYLKTSDGDTARFEVEGENERIRFLGINTPEVSGEEKVEEPYGNEALAYTKKRLENAKKVEIEYDSVADKEDRFGRKLAWIWVDDALLEVDLLEQGLAKTYMLKNNYKYASELKEAEQKAKEAKVGLWSEEVESLSDENKATDTAQNISNASENATRVEEDEQDSFNMYIGVFVVIIVIYFLLNRKRKQ